MTTALLNPTRSAARIRMFAAGRTAPIAPARAQAHEQGNGKKQIAVRVIGAGGLRTLTLAACALALSSAGWAAGHDAPPLIKQEPPASISDIYTFVGTKYDNAAQPVLNVIVHVRPFSEPVDGVSYERDARYSIHIANPTSGATLARYDFRFSAVHAAASPGLEHPNTALAYGRGSEANAIMLPSDAPNGTQTYIVRRTLGTTSAVIGSNLPTAPANVGGRTTPDYNDAAGKAISGAATVVELDPYTAQTLRSLASGEAVWAGPREGSSHADRAALLGLLEGGIRVAGDGTADGVDGWCGDGVLAFAIQIPLDMLAPFATVYSAAFANLVTPLPAIGKSFGVGVYASIGRPRVSVRTESGIANGGTLVQRDRMGNPLFNEMLVVPSDQDRYNRSAPSGDTSFATFALNPAVATLINDFFGTRLATRERSDLALVYIPDVIRVDITTPAVPLAGQAGFSRFGFVGGDTVINGAGHIMSSGWPNGRRLGDDVVDIALTAVASGPGYTKVTVVGDNVAASDQVYNQVFPYSATPRAGGTDRPQR